MTANDSGTWRLHATEAYPLKMLTVVEDTLNSSDDIAKLSRRIDAIPQLREQVEALQALMGTVIARMWLSVPKKQRESITNQLRYSEIRIGAKAAAADPGQVVLSTHDLGVLIDAALGMQCFCCTKTEGQAHACPLRKVLDGVTVHTRPRIRGCSYREGYLEEEGKPWPQPPGKREKEET